MTTLLQEVGHQDVRRPCAPESNATLYFGREDIHFRDIAPGRVRIEITVRNEGDERSEPTLALIDAAPLGAFVSWQPLTLLRVPGIEPGGSAVLRTDVIRPRTAALGPPDRVPPRRLLTALGAADREPSRESSWARSPLLSRLVRSGASNPVLPADLFDLLGRGNPHFAGNLNVFIGTRAVERHLAQALRIYPGRTNMAMFVVGSGPDVYAFHLTGYGADWDAALFDMSRSESPAFSVRNGSPIALHQWVEVNGPCMMMLALCPPEYCLEETVEVHVTQRSTGRTAVVEFSFDPQASGAGCFVVE